MCAILIMVCFYWELRITSMTDMKLEKTFIL